MKTKLVLAAIVLLIVALAAFMYWKRSAATPDCSKYSGDVQTMCKATTDMCSSLATSDSSRRSCLNAVAQCTPVINGTYQAVMGANNPKQAASDPAFVLNTVNVSQLKACTNAITKIDPVLSSKIIRGAQPRTCVPPNASKAISIGDVQKVASISSALAPLLPYSLKVAQQLPSCPSQVHVTTMM